MHVIQVAILCNHQRAVPKTHAKSMETMEEKRSAAEKALKDVQADLKRVKAGKEPENGKKRSADACVSHEYCPLLNCVSAYVLICLHALLQTESGR